MEMINFNSTELVELNSLEMNDIDGGYPSIREMGHAIISWLFD